MKKRSQINPVTFETISRVNAQNTLKEFISSTFTPPSRNRTLVTSPLRHAQDTDEIKPTAGASVIQNVEDESSAQNTSQAACVLIISDDGKVLVVSRKDDPAKFGLPGGKVDPGETAVGAAARELEEETGLNASNLNPIFASDDYGRMCTTFVGKVTGRIDTNEAGIVRWVDPNVLLDPTTSPFVKYIRRLFDKIGLV